MDSDGSLVLYTLKKTNGYTTVNNIRYGINNSINNGINNTINKGINNTINKGINNTINKGINNTINKDINNGPNDTTTYYSIKEYSDNNKKVLGKVAYIDNDSNLREYPNNMLQYSNMYFTKTNYNSPDNNLDSAAPEANTIKKCETACNENPLCAGFVFKSALKKCTLKNSGMYPAGEAIYENGSQMSIRVPTLIPGVFKNSDGGNNVQCGTNTITPIYATKYNAYKMGDAMNSNVDCSIKPFLEPESSNFNSSAKQLNSTSNIVLNNKSQNESTINTTTEKLLNTNVNIESTRENNNKNLKQIYDLNASNATVKKEEGFGNLSNMDDFEAMLSDSDISVLQENYSYIMWGTLAVGLLSITISSVR
jgi:hypothetical protein